MKITTFIAAAFIAVIPSFSGASIIHVPADQPTIQAAISAAVSGDTIVVDPGTYYENIIFRGKNIVLTSRFYETGDLSYIRSTILNGSKPAFADTASCILIINHEDSTAVVQGFTITGGIGTKWKDEHSSGTYREGGGILTASTAPTIRFNLFINNNATTSAGVSSTGGGGVRSGDGNPKILNNVFLSNAGRYGAAIVLNYSGAVVRNNILIKNTGGQDYGGGALWINADGSKPKIIENNSIVNNSVTGIYTYQGSSTVKNCILWGNSTSQISTLRGGGPAVTCSDVQGGYSGSGNMNSNPLLIDSTCLLQSSSPCIDAGDSSAIYNDIDSSGTVLPPSQGGMRNDIGAYGGQGRAALLFPYSVTGLIRAFSAVSTGLTLDQNYPNPFNPATIISYSLTTGSTVILKLYDLTGREIKTFVHEYQRPGTHHVVFNAGSLASGVYFYRLQACSSVQTKQLVVLK